ncbi:hypothetical protein AC579_163 [Pseudocercospora musae]|uniref:Uncharacterized protein n=1 Tax=Pseudocercospora musae TaxID=113226 RepID=A0A139IA42_9PEZI|nr:hypothetical protein AC579_163 [Pseudocercospora musae]
MARPSMLVIEHKLGFRPSQVMHLSDLSKHPLWLGLLGDIEPILQRYANMTHAQLRDSTEFASDVGVLAAHQGPRIWSDDLGQRDQLLTRAARNTHNGHYPEDLYWSNSEHQEIIIALLRELVMEKVINFRAQEKRWWNKQVDIFIGTPIGDARHERESSNPISNGSEAREARDSVNEGRRDTPNQS